MISDPQNDNQLPDFLQEIMSKDIDPNDKIKIQQSLEKLKNNPKTSPIFSLIGGLTGFPLNKIIESIGKNIESSKSTIKTNSFTDSKEQSSDILFGSVIDSVGNATAGSNAIPQKSLSNATAHSAQTKAEIPQEIMEQLPSSIKTTLLSGGKYSSSGNEKPLLKNTPDLRAILFILTILGFIAWAFYGYFKF